MIDKVDNIWRPIEDIYRHADYLAEGPAGRILCRRLQQVMRSNCREGWDVEIRVSGGKANMTVMTGESKFSVAVNLSAGIHSSVSHGDVSPDDMGFQDVWSILTIQIVLCGFLKATGRLDTVYRFKTVRPLELPEEPEEAAK